MGNLMEFLRRVLSYLMVFGVIAVVSAAGAIVGVKLWKPKKKEEKSAE